LIEETSADTHEYWEPIKLKHFNVWGYLWILYALIAGLSFGLAAFSIGSASYFGFKARLVMAWGEMTAIVLYYIYYFINKKLTKGYIYKWKESHFKNVQNDKIWWVSVLAALS